MTPSAKHYPLIGLLAAASAALTTTPAHASPLWDGDASQGTGVFGNLNCDSPGSITAVDDSAKGRVWRYAKPSGSNRCENHGISVGGSRYTFRNGQTYYLGWSSKLSSTVNNNAVFQWKSYGNHIQNFPVVLKVIGNKLSLLQRQPTSESIIWQKPVAANAWNTLAVGLHLSDATRSGWVELYYNGTQQTFSDGTKRYACRTFDSQNEPKWGIYGASGTTVTNYVDGLKVGTTYDDVN